MVFMACGSTKIADDGMPWASAAWAITRASTNWLWVAAPERISRDATPRWYSWTASATLANCEGVGLPSESAGVPRTTMASKRVSEVLEAGASWRAIAPQASRATVSTAAARVSRPCQLRRFRRAGAGRRPALRGCLRGCLWGKAISSSLHCNAEAGGAVASGGAGQAQRVLVIGDGWPRRPRSRQLGQPVERVVSEGGREAVGIGSRGQIAGRVL